MTTGIIAGLYLVIAGAAVLIVTHNLTAAIDNTLSTSLTSLAEQRSHPGPGFGGPPGEAPFGAPVLLWTFHPDGNYDTRNSAAANVDLPVKYDTIKDAKTITVSGTDIRVAGGRVGDDWAVVGQTMKSVYDARANLVVAELLIAPILLAIVFLGALAIGRRVGSPIESARRRQMDFTANASHELRTPLSVIEAQTSLALSQPRDGEWYRRAFQSVDQESKRMRQLVEDLLWLARMDATRGGTKAEPVDVGVMAEQAVDRFASVAEARRLRLSIKLDGDTHVIAAPPDWLDHLVGVLLDNACKYSPEDGSVDVRVAADGDRVRLTVDDSGPGIPVDQRRRIFERFQRATDQGNGAGLGLAIADAVVRATSGRWDVGTSAAGGASMSVVWPRVLAGARSSAPAPATQPQLGS